MSQSLPAMATDKDSSCLIRCSSLTCVDDEKECGIGRVRVGEDFEEVEVRVP